jgi:hypothetical protein
VWTTALVAPSRGHVRRRLIGHGSRCGRVPPPLGHRARPATLLAATKQEATSPTVASAGSLSPPVIADSPPRYSGLQWTRAPSCAHARPDSSKPRADRQWPPPLYIHPPHIHILLSLARPSFRLGRFLRPRLAGCLVRSIIYPP